MPYAETISLPRSELRAIVAARALPKPCLLVRCHYYMTFILLVAALLFAMLFSAISLSLRFPFWGAIRASYLLAAVVPAAVCAGVGGSRVHAWLGERFGTGARALYCGWLGAFVGTLVAAFGG